MALFGSTKDADIWFKHTKQIDKKKLKSKEQKEIIQLKKKIASLEKQVEYWKKQYHRERSCHEHNPPNWRGGKTCVQKHV